MTQRFGIRRRRRIAALVACGALGCGVVAFGLSAGADVVPPGSVTVAISGTVRLPVNGTQTTLGPFTGSAAGTVDADGNLSFPQAGITLNSFSATIIVPAVIQPQATGAWTGTINPTSGAVTLAGSLRTLASVAAFGISNCPVGPWTLQASTSKPGASPYSTATGKATVVDNAYTVPHIPSGAVGCAGIEGTIDQTLGFPSAAGAQTTTLALTFTPKLDIATTTTSASTSTSTSATTTVEPTSATTTVEPTSTTTTVAEPTPSTSTSTTIDPSASTTSTTMEADVPSTAGAPSTTPTTSRVSGGTSPTTTRHPTGRLPFTGGPLLPLTFIGGALLAGGLALTARRRR